MGKRIGEVDTSMNGRRSSAVVGREDKEQEGVDARDMK
jgi:hypothetical protein